MKIILTGCIVLLLLIGLTGCNDHSSQHPGTQDKIAPTMSSTFPVHAATDVPINRQLTATFSEAMNPLTINGTTFVVTGPGTTPVAGIVTYANPSATFTPTGVLAVNTTYTATITTGAKDLAGNALASNKAWTFTTGAAADTTAPTINTTFPATGTTGVAVNGNIAVTFSETMDPSTFTTATMTLKQGSTPVAGTLTYVGNTATFNPTNALAGNTTYTATITTGVTDLAGNALANNIVWTFTTGTTADTSKPTVMSTLPAAGATGVAVNTGIIATFSEAMDPLTFTTTTMTLKKGTTPVAGSVTATSTTTAAFNPTSALIANTTYTVTVTTGVTDLAGNALAVAKTWTFTTLAVAAAGPQPVDLGTAGNYVLLAKTGISTTGATAIVGHIGVSPASLSYITGFSQTLDSTNVFATSDLVTGKIYAANMATPTPANLTAAISDLETAYTDAAGRPMPDFNELYSGDISGKTLIPGLYKWGTGVSVNSDVTLHGGPTDVWIFQVAGNLTVAGGKKIILSGGAVPENIFWQVAGHTTLGTTSSFKGILLCKTNIALQTGAVLTGRALAQTAVTLDANAVSQPAQ